MTSFVRDLTADLKGKPLVALAAGALLIALVAVLLLLPKPVQKAPASAPPPPANTPVAAANGPGGYQSIADIQPIVQEQPSFADQTTKKNNKFVRKNPFAGLPGGAAAAGDAGTATTDGTGTTTTGGTDTTTVPTGDSGSGGGSSTSYHYVVTARFGQEGKKQKDKKLTSLRSLPDSNNAVIVFLGVRSDGRTAVFLMSSSATTTGDGSCVPSDDECSFIYMKKNDVQTIEAVSSSGEVTTYELKLIKISLEQDSTPTDTGSTGGGGTGTGDTGTGDPTASSLKTATRETLQAQSAQTGRGQARQSGQAARAQAQGCSPAACPRASGRPRRRHGRLLDRSSGGGSGSDRGPEV